eukprot:TRINITY_DN2380_c0_g1_i1.p1 TRINITY_DN2380_c0_g1~~TRINITY_DN2380_c0_g1_i1.p1  ORF type:complete len:210 (+),score=62.86 TRINITY_DN2380_c0_g1_i1:42-671(+)
MVFYFTTVDPAYIVYMGEHKEENEDLIKFGWPEDLWFHVDKHSSAHVYLRLKPGDTMTSIPPQVLEDCCQLVKANSIEGSKLNNITIVYTPWSNLKKTGDMDVGQVGFHDSKLVLKYKVEKKKNEIINRLNKTKREAHPDLKADRDKRDRDERNKKKQELKDQQSKEKQEAEEKRKHDEEMDYGRIMDSSSMVSNRGAKTAQEYEEDFM